MQKMQNTTGQFNLLFQDKTYLVKTLLSEGNSVKPQRVSIITNKLLLLTGKNCKKVSNSYNSLILHS